MKRSVIFWNVAVLLIAIGISCIHVILLSLVCSAYIALTAWYGVELLVHFEVLEEGPSWRYEEEWVEKMRYYVSNWPISCLIIPIAFVGFRLYVWDFIKDRLTEFNKFLDGEG